MKLAIICDSPLLDRCLEYYLKDYVTSYRQCDFVVADKPLEIEKPLCLIGTTQEAYIKKPFTRTQLITGLEEFFKSLELRPRLEEIPKEHPDYELRQKIEESTARFAQEIYWMVREHYDKRH